MGKKSHLHEYTLFPCLSRGQHGFSEHLFMFPQYSLLPLLSCSNSDQKTMLQAKAGSSFAVHHRKETMNAGQTLWLLRFHANLSTEKDG